MTKISQYREPWNCLHWKRTWRPLSQTINPALPYPPLIHVLKNHIYMSFKYLKGWLLLSFTEHVTLS